MEMHVHPTADVSRREQILRQWYRQELRKIIPPMLEKWQSVLNVQITDWGIKRMKTKWGSCNAEARRIWINLELAKKPIKCLEYTVVHEMAHFIDAIARKTPVRTSIEDGVKALALADAATRSWRERRIIEL